MRIPADAHRAVLTLLALGVWILTLAAIDGHAVPVAAAVLALAGAALVASRGGWWTAVGGGASLAATSVLTLGSAPASLTLLVNVSGQVLVMAAGLRLALELLRAQDAAARPVVAGVLGFLTADFAVVHDAATGAFSPFALVLPAAALLPLAYGACRAQLQPGGRHAAARLTPAAVAPRSPS